MILFKGKIDILLFIEFLGFPINRILYLSYFLGVEFGTKIPKTQKRKVSTQRYNDSSLLKRFKRFSLVVCVNYH